MQHFFLAFLIFFHPLLTHELVTEPEPIEKVILVVDKGDSLRTIAKKLSNEGIIENEILFEFFARLSNVDRVIKSGEYYISKYQSIHEILSNLSSGSVISNRITIPEGTTSFQVVKMLNALDSLVGEISILPPEGSISPDTYFFSNGQNRLHLLRHMQESQSKKLKKIWKNRSEGLSLRSLEDLLILASIIEKETGKHSEREFISSVLHNRLNKKMRLQADPTVIYGITEGKRKLGRRLLKSDLNTFSSYNTYMVKGLPEAPICNPGEASLFAAANPANSDFFFYVADGKGGHNFSQTLKEHNKNVRVWRKIRNSLSSD